MSRGRFVPVARNVSAIAAIILVASDGAAQKGPEFAPPLIGQGLRTRVGTLIVPKVTPGKEQFLGLGVNLYARDSQSESAVGMWSWCQTGTSSANCFAANFGTQWAPGSPDISSQAVEIDYNNNNRPDFKHYHNGLTIFSGGRYPADIGAFIGASRPGQNNWHTGLEISSFDETGLLIANNLHSPPGDGAAVIQQRANGANTIVVQRAETAGSRGNLFSAVDATNTKSLFNVDTAGNLYVAGNINMAGGYERPTLTTVARLAKADPSPQPGDRIAVSDAVTCVIDTPVRGGGARSCPLVYSGSAWKAAVSN